MAAGEAEDRFRLEVRRGLPETWLDADKIDQILGNLVENAVRHGAGIVTIVIEPALIDDVVAASVSVRDQGEGIAPDIAPRVFRQFWRGKPRGGRNSRHGGGELAVAALLSSAQYPTVPLPGPRTTTWPGIRWAMLGGSVHPEPSNLVLKLPNVSMPTPR